MKQLITREYWIPKIVTFFGMFAGLCNVAASDWGYGARYTMFHTVVTLIYMMIAVGTALYCIHKRRKSSLVTAAIHWSAVILLTLPVIFEKFGLFDLQLDRVLYSYGSGAAQWCAVRREPVLGREAGCTGERIVSRAVCGGNAGTHRLGHAPDGALSVSVRVAAMSAKAASCSTNTMVG